MLTAVIVDDVKKSRDAIKVAINKYYPTINLLAEANSVKSGIEIILTHSPNLVFLDVEMEDGTGFDLLKAFSDPLFKVIFVTAYEEYALKAIKHNAFEYLLKPIDKNEFVKTIIKLEKQLGKENISLQLSTLLSRKKEEDPPKIILRTSNLIVPVFIADIIRCQSDNVYTTFYIKNKLPIVVSVSLKEYVEKLVPHNFYRIHQSHLINMDYFDHFIKNEGGFVVMKDGAMLPVSSRKKLDFVKFIENWS